MTRPEPLDFRVGISRANDLALLAAGYETGWWDEHGVPAPWPDDFFHTASGRTCGDTGYPPNPGRTETNHPL